MEYEKKTCSALAIIAILNPKNEDLLASFLDEDNGKAHVVLPVKGSLSVADKNIEGLE